MEAKIRGVVCLYVVCLYLDQSAGAIELRVAEKTQIQAAWLACKHAHQLPLHNLAPCA